MLLRSADPFRDFDRLAQQVLGTTNRPAVMAMDAWREGDAFAIEFDLPGVARDTVELDVERNVLTVRAERVARNGDWRCSPPSARGGVQPAAGAGRQPGPRPDRGGYDGGVLAWSSRSPSGPSPAASRSARRATTAPPSRPESCGAGGLALPAPLPLSPRSV